MRDAKRKALSFARLFGKSRGRSLCFAVGLIFVAATPIGALADARFSAPAAYRVANQGDDWRNLNAEEQQVLRAHRERWSQYSPAQRQQLREGVRRYRSLSPQEQSEVWRGRERYQNLLPEEREQMREQYERSRRGRQR